MKQFERILEKLTSWLVIASISGIFFFVIIQVIFRFVLQSPLPWPEELSRILFIYLVFIGGAEASMQRDHIAIDVVDSLFRNPRTKISVDIVRSLLVLTALAVVIQGAWKIIPTTRYMALPATGLPMPVMVVPVLVGSVFMAIWTALHLARDVQALRAPGKDS